MCHDGPCQIDVLIAMKQMEKELRPDEVRPVSQRGQDGEDEDGGLHDEQDLEDLEHEDASSAMES